MRVIGVDQSYTGFGFSVDGESKKKSFPLSKFEGDEVKRLKGIQRWWEHWLTLQMSAGIDLVVMEGYANAAKFGREISGELGGIVKVGILDVTGNSPLIVPPGSLKKFVSGSGAAKKNTMIMHVFKKWGQEFSDDNQADAFALEKFGYAYVMLRDEPDWVRESGHLKKYQIEAIEAVRKGK